MKTNQKPSPSLDELAAATVRLGRDLGAMAHRVYLGGNARDFGFVNRTLRRLAERNPFDPRDEHSLEALGGIIERELKSEVVGIERRFFETRHDEFGQDGEVRECPVYSERGQAILTTLRPSRRSSPHVTRLSIKSPRNARSGSSSPRSASLGARPTAGRPARFA